VEVPATLGFALAAGVYDNGRSHGEDADVKQ
jgi:hypothetical protein